MKIKTKLKDILDYKNYIKSEISNTKRRKLDKHIDKDKLLSLETLLAEVEIIEKELRQ